MFRQLKPMALVGLHAGLPIATTAAALPADRSKAPIPPGPANGRLNCVPFQPENTRFQRVQKSRINGVDFDANTLIFRHDDGKGEDILFLVSIISPPGKLLDGLAFRAVTGDVGAQPMAAPGAPEVQGWDYQYDPKQISVDSMQDKTGSLRLEFGRRKAGELPGKIYFCTPTGGGSWLAGSFTIDVDE